MSAISSVASMLGVSETSAPVTAGIGALDQKTGVEKSGSLQAFQYFPETVSDSKSPEWSRRTVPGGSHPLMSFVHGGERSITFPAIFTQEDNPEPIGLISGLLTGSFSLSASSLLGKKERKDTVDIAAAIAYLRQFTYPKYVNDLANPPPFVVVYLPNSGIVSAMGGGSSFVGAMTQCDVTYEAFHRNGSPRIATVQLGFVEVVQVGPNWRFSGSESFQKQADSYKRTMIGAPESKNSGFSIGGVKLL